MRKNLTVLQGLAAVTLALMLVLTVIAACIPSDGMKLIFSSPASYSDGWTEVPGGAEADYSWKYLASGETLTLSKSLPSSIGQDTCLYLRNSRFHITVYVDGVPVFECGALDPLSFGTENGDLWDAISLSPDDAGKTVTLKVENLGRASAFNLGSALLGTRNDANLAILRGDTGVLVSSAVLTLFGILLLGYAGTLRKQDLRFGHRCFLWLGLFSVDAAAWCLISSSFFQFVSSNASARFELLYFTFMLLPLIAALYYAELTRHYKKPVYGYCAVYCVFLITVLLLYPAGILHISYVLPFIHMAILILIVLLLGICASELRRYRDRSMLGTLAALAVLSTAAVVDMVVFYQTNMVDLSLYFRLGLLLFLALLAATSLRQSIRESRELYILEHYNSMPCGVLYFVPDRSRALFPSVTGAAYAFNEECVRLLGYPDKEALHRAFPAGILAPEESARMREYVHLASQGKRQQARLSMRRFDGSPAHCSVVFEQRCLRNGSKVVQCVFLDETETVEAEEKLRLSEETCRMVIENSKSIIHYYSIPDKTSYLPDRLCSLLGMPKVMRNVPESVVDSGSVAPGSVETYLQFYRTMRAGEPCGEPRVIERRTADGSSVWLQAYYTVTRDAQGAPSSAVIYLDDVTAARRREDSLLLLAERDGLTGVYNRSATEEHIRELLASQDGRSCVFLLFDIDDLKKINDSFGHACGDSAIRSAAAAIAGHFRKSDVIGRVGGDEFVAFLPGVNSADWLQSSLDTFLREMSVIRIGQDNRIELRCSVGGAFGTAERTDFSQLYRNADEALYKTKDGGKFGYAFFTPEGELRRSPRLPDGPSSEPGQNG